MSLHASWHARIIGPQGPVGAGVLVDSRRIVTCAHVIRDALRLSDLTQPPSGLVTIDFPQNARSEIRTAQVAAGGWFPVRPGVRAGDLAMLEVLGGIVRSADPAPLGNAGDGSRILGVLGHPDGYDIGAWARARLTGVGGPVREWVQLDALAGQGMRIQPGFSGAGLLDEEDGTVVGVVVAAARSPQDRLAWMIPVEVICGYWPDLRALVRPRAGGYLPASGETGTPVFDIERFALMLLDLRGIASRTDRELFIDAIENQFPGRLVVQRHDGDLRDTAALVGACLRHPGALHELVELIRQYHSGNTAEERRVVEIAAIAEEADPAPLLDRSSRNKLYRILSALEDRITVDMVRSAYREAAGPLVAEPIAPHDTQSVIRVLESATTGANGLPPLLGFLEGLAALLPGVADELRDWVDEFASRESIPRHLIARVRLARPPTTPRSAKSYLVAELRDFGASADHYLGHVTLVQGDRRSRTPNALVLHAGDTPLQADDVPSLFVAVLDEVWQRTDIQIDELEVELVLPLKLLGLPVDQWTTEEAQPLCVEHQVTVRYRDRLGVRRAHGQWRERSKQVREGGTSVRWVDPSDADAVGRLFVQLVRDGDQCVALAQPPPTPQPAIKADAIWSAIRAGVPVIVWCRDRASRTAFARRLRSNFAEKRIIDLPSLVRQMRSEFIESGYPPGGHITLLWDLEDEPTSLAPPLQAPG
ncbi:MAG TPA: trypsin-like peptidase domain-containing protein [Trebonia sp.]